MATTVTNGTLKVTITEQCYLNGKNQGGSQTLSISNIDEIFKRIISVPTSELLLYDTHDSNVAGSTFDDDNIKYVRITNLDDENYIVLRVKNADNDEFAYKLNSGESFLLYQHEGTMNAATAATIDIGTGWHDISSLKATAPTAACDIEVFIASI
tara:strand:- start:6954 stop:7418 length:465 start_codon:yes stop_codon:yes gene_type:complete